MASRKHYLSKDPEQPEPSGKKTNVNPEDSKIPNAEKKRPVLNPADCDLDFDVEGDGLKGSALHDQAFAYCWSGARSNVGITGGKYCFSCKIISFQPVDMQDTPTDQQHVCRVGISRGDDPVGKLGETEHGFGFGGTGKFSTSGRFSIYGEKFGIGDTIVCTVDLESKPLASIGYSKNGRWLGTANQFDAGPRGLRVVDSPVRKLQWESAVFPHVLLKNVVVQVQFSVEEGLVPEEGYKPWALALDDGNAIMGPNFPNIKDCEVMMMVGLPASGKTTWSEKWVKEHPEKRYVLLGTNLILDQMKVPGLLRKNNYGERFDHLMSRANAIFDTLLPRAARTPRNYIIDQTNVYKSARKRKLRPFANFRKIAVVVFPKPEVLKYRADKRFKEMGKEVPAEAIDNMLANFVLPLSRDMPGSDEFFDQVIFSECNRGESQRYLDDMKSLLGSRTYSRDSSVESYTRDSMHNQGIPSVAGQNSQHFHPTRLPTLGEPDFYQMQNRLNSAYHGRKPYDRPFQAYENPTRPITSAPYGVSERIEDGFVLRGNIGYSSDYDAVNGIRRPYGRPDIVGNSAFPDGSVDFYREGIVVPSPVGSSRASTYSQDPLRGQFRAIGSPHIDQHAQRLPTYLPPPRPTRYGPPYGNPPGRPY